VIWTEFLTTSMVVLSRCERILVICLAVLAQYQLVTDRQTDGRTDGLTERRNQNRALFVNEYGRTINTKSRTRGRIDCKLKLHIVS